MSEEFIIDLLRRDGYLDAVTLINNQKNEINKLTRETVIEMCPHCGNEIEMAWSINDRGYKAFCSVCGKRLMLCDECMHSGPDGEFVGKCDYCSETDTCQHNKKEENYE